MPGTQSRINTSWINYWCIKVWRGNLRISDTASLPRLSTMIHCGLFYFIAILPICLQVARFSVPVLSPGGTREKWCLPFSNLTQSRELMYVPLFGDQRKKWVSHWSFSRGPWWALDFLRLSSLSVRLFISVTLFIDFSQEMKMLGLAWWTALLGVVHSLCKQIEALQWRGAHGSWEGRNISRLELLASALWHWDSLLWGACALHRETFTSLSDLHLSPHTHTHMPIKTIKSSSQATGDCYTSWNKLDPKKANITLSLICGW